MDPALLPNAAYFLQLVALSVKDVLWLRAVLIPAQTIFLVWGALLGYVPTVAWNAIFIGTNSVQIVRILRERRPIELPAELCDLYERAFSEMTRREFLLFWETGRHSLVEGEPLLRDGEHPEELLFLVSGEAKVLKENHHIATFDRGSFAGELFFLTGEPASADVEPVGKVGCISWDQTKLRRLESINPDLSYKLQKILGRDVTGKIRTASSRISAV